MMKKALILNVAGALIILAFFMFWASLVGLMVCVPAHP